jgi:hypothetical protein
MRKSRKRVSRKRVSRKRVSRKRVSRKRKSSSRKRVPLERRRVSRKSIKKHVRYRMDNLLLRTEADALASKYNLVAEADRAGGNYCDLLVLASDINFDAQNTERSRSRFKKELGDMREEMNRMQAAAAAPRTEAVYRGCAAGTA